MPSTSPYPPVGQLLRLVLPALLATQFLVWPLVGLHSTHLGMIVAELFILWIMTFFIRRHRLMSEDLLLLNATPLSSLLIAGVTALGASLFIAELDLYWGELVRQLDLAPPLSFQRSMLELQVVRTPLDLIGGLLAVVVVPGVGEELFFRGFVFTSLCYHRGPWTALIGSALLFAASHINPWQLPALLLYGLFLGLLVYWTHSIYPAILAHIANNFLSFVGVNLRAYLGLEFFSPFEHLPLPLFLAAGLVLVVGIHLLRKRPTMLPLINRPPLPADPAFLN